MYNCICIHMYYVSTHDNIVYVHITIRVPCPRMDFSLIFKSWFLEAPRTVPFHSAATHCHDGRDIEDASLFVLE